MPKSTFFNLSEEKRNRILDVAINEFSKSEYSDVTISGIVKAAGIPKGSFYQYFEDKFDLYYHIVILVGEKKKSYFGPVLQAMQKNDFFETLGEMYKSGLKFAAENEKLAKIGTLLMRSNDKQLLDKIYSNMGGQVDDFLGPFIKQAVDSGQLRDDIDVSFLSFIFGKFNMVFAEYFFNVKQGENFEEYVKSIDVMLDLFKHGAVKRNKL